MGKVPWTQRIQIEDKDFLDTVIEAFKIEKGLSSKGDALVCLVKNWAQLHNEDSEVVYPEIRIPADTDFETTCPFGFLKKISDKKGREDLWHCLKQQGLNTRGKPVLLADGRDKKSIRAICETCQINWQRGPKNIDTIKLVFERLGEQEVSSNFYFCVRDALGEGIKLSPSKHGSFFCVDRRKKVVVKNTCMDKRCPFLVMKSVSLNLVETIPYMEAQRALEALR